MGSLTIKNKLLRCEKCFMLKLITIEPNYPQTTVCSECFCGFTRQSLLSFSKDLQKEELFKIKCSFCSKEPKHPSYCTGCRRTYCTTCKQAHDTEIQTKTPHNLIDSFKFDFYCSTHQDVLVNAYCKTCTLNICQNCINEKLHKGHRFTKFSKIILSPNDEENLKEKLKVNSEQIEENVNKSIEIIRLQNKQEKIKEIKEVRDTTISDNRSIISLIKYFYKIYTEMKNKNYAIIFNLTDNIKFNPQIIPPERESLASIEQNTTEFLEYLKREFVLFKRFNAPKARSNTTYVNPQKTFLNKKISKPEIKEEEENKNDNIKKLKTDVNNDKKEPEIKNISNKGEANYHKVFGIDRLKEKTENNEQDKEDKEVNFNIKEMQNNDKNINIIKEENNNNNTNVNTNN